MDKAQIIAIIAEQLGISEAEITEETSFTDLGADSLDVLEIIMGIEDEFGIEIPTDQAESIVTVGDAYEKIKEAL
mgnify:CR=1 FL=1